LSYSNSDRKGTVKREWKYRHGRRRAIGEHLHKAAFELTCAAFRAMDLREKELESLLDLLRDAMYDLAGKQWDILRGDAPPSVCPCGFPGRTRDGCPVGLCEACPWIPDTEREVPLGVVFMSPHGPGERGWFEARIDDKLCGHHHTYGLRAADCRKQAGRAR